MRKITVDENNNLISDVNVLEPKDATDIVGIPQSTIKGSYITPHYVNLIRTSNYSIDNFSIFYTYFYFAKNAVFDAVGFVVNREATNGGMASMGVYSIGDNGLPDQLIQQFGSFSTENKGYIEVLLDQPWVAPSGLYAVALHFNDKPARGFVVADSRDNFFGLAANLYGLDAPSENSPSGFLVIANSYSSVLPENANIAGISREQRVPLVYLRVA